MKNTSVKLQAPASVRYSACFVISYCGFSLELQWDSHFLPVDHMCFENQNIVLFCGVQ